MPFEIPAGAPSAFFQVRMRRLGAVSGSVLDENNVGIPDWPVQIYTARKPVRHIGETKTDDRGNFRIGELEPGIYLVRSGIGTLEDETPLLPSWFKFGTAIENAEPLRVRVGETQPDVVLRPAKGRLVQISGFLNRLVPAVVTLITDAGRRVLAQERARFQSAVAPGTVELLAEAKDGSCAGYTRIPADHDTSAFLC
jgi:hypothetical protein